MLPASFPPNIVERVMREMQPRLYQQRVVFDTIAATWVGIAVYGRKHTQAPTNPPTNVGTVLAALQAEFHQRLNEELASAIQRGDPEVANLGYTFVKNIVPGFPHFSLAYTEVGQNEGVLELEQTGVLVRNGPSLYPIQDDVEQVGEGLTLAGHRGFQVGALYAAYCGGLKPEKWRVFLRIEN